MHAVLAALLLSLATLVGAALYSDPRQLPQKEYDFVIVGGGTAGNALASRLSEVSKFSILVIEAGSSNTDYPEIAVPFLELSEVIYNSNISWNYDTTPQIGLNNRAINYPRGKVLGGSSSINVMIWTRASVDDWDRYAAVTGDPEWSWDAMFPYMLKSESLVPPASGPTAVNPGPGEFDYATDYGTLNPAVHNTRGPVDVSFAGYLGDIASRVFQTSFELPETFSFVPDMNAGYPLGFAQLSITSSGRRSSSATAYLEPAINRPNLDVLINTQVTRLIAAAESVNTSLPTFTTVEMAQSADGTRYTISASKEVILSAGSINTPQLLLLSGIGAPSALAAHNIIPLVNSSGVGADLQDHPLLESHWYVNSTGTFDTILRNATLQAEDLSLWEQEGRGPYVGPGVVQIAWTKLENENVVFGPGGYPDPSAGPSSPNIEILPTDGFVSFIEGLPATGNFLTMLTSVVSPVSRGSVTLASADPFDAPLIDPGLLSNPYDVLAAVQAVNQSRQFLSAPTWDDYILREAPDLAAAQSEAELEAYVRKGTTTIWHPVGTARMGAPDDELAVLTSDLRVKGAQGLRVVDASIFPYIPAGHPQACVYAVAERAADLIKEAWGVL
ncbi:GMC oxidoreductase [Laetiporus sulphureus 93-53]|uniref:GMC oxidoreductase n=1 Tax=Laetiporus sulphureus 93-53 TaxID=1314785 RepID=A0A165CZJ8_9APHY|nr:GMC oxidoreductase [Laetiporus sulphureus 93-53]KZT03822.1 GMC oxidoreductase [Laetiporus sulphureus 93-53]